MNVRTFFVGALLVAGVLPLAAWLPAAGRLSTASRLGPSVVDSVPERIDWPTHFRDQPLTPLPLSELELRFAQRFPGAIARFTDGERIVILRQVDRPTRQLHPASDCFAALGYRVDRARPSVDADGMTWSCFLAERDGRRVRICERIHDRQGRAWTDVSSWFWSAQYGGGPWLALTVVETAQ
ncbi:MAG TPA: hypothetical protein VMK32_08720 [Burkholderiaceae bacterium]|nr:hypothetical protein [Burkholderiaceae bacterium]